MMGGSCISYGTRQSCGVEGRVAGQRVELQNIGGGQSCSAEGEGTKK